MERPTSRQRSPPDYADVEVSTRYTQSGASDPAFIPVDTGSIDSRWRGAIADSQNTLALR